MENTVTGINEQGIEELSIEILNFRDKISELFDKIDSNMNNLPNIYQGEPCNNLIDSYNDLKQNFTVIKDNLKNYSDDLIFLIQKVKEDDKYLAGLFQTMTEDKLARNATNLLNSNEER